MPYALAIHTSSPDLGLAIRSLESPDLGRSQVWPLGRDLSSQLQLHLQAFLPPQTWQDLALIAVAVGPGGFTGTRMGVVTARTLAQQLQIPLFGISSLAAIAASTYPTQAEWVAVEMPAQRAEIFGSVYEVDWSDAQHPICQPRWSDQVMTPTAWEAQLATLPTPFQRIAAPSQQGEFVNQVLDLALHDWQQGQRPDWSTVLPFYGQHPVIL